MSWTCPGHYKVHVHGHCPVPLPALPNSASLINFANHVSSIITCSYPTS